MFTYTDDQSINFLNTFGYLKLKLPIDFQFDCFVSEVSRLAVQQFSVPWQEILQQKTACAVQPFADNSNIATKFLVNTLDPYIKILLGDNYIYLGSDASIFFDPGSAWHRDMATRVPVFKLLIYLDYNYNDISSDFILIPGSHHVGSLYSALLQKGLAWPDKHGFMGGLSENGFFPSPSDPTDPCYDNEFDVIPNKLIQVKRGAAILFNQALIHAVKSKIQAGKVRRLVTYNFCVNPNDIKNSVFNFNSSPELNNQYSYDLNDIYAIYAMQYQRLGIDNYGKELLEYPDYISRHGLDWPDIIKFSKNICISLNKETGRQSSVQASKMKNYLTTGIRSII